MTPPAVRQRWVALAVAAVALTALSACGGTAAAPKSETTPPPSPVATFTPLFTKARACVLPPNAWADDNTTLILDGTGADDPSDSAVGSGSTDGKVSKEMRQCVFDKLETPDSIRTKMNQTRALDGRQEDSAGGFTYSWTFHPDSGLDIVITDDEG